MPSHKAAFRPKRDFKQAVAARVQRDPKFRQGAVHRGAQFLPDRRHRDRQGYPARSGQRHGRLREPGAGGQATRQEPVPDARPARQPRHRELLRHRQRAAEENRGQAARDRDAALNKRSRQAGRSGIIIFQGLGATSTPAILVFEGEACGREAGNENARGDRSVAGQGRLDRTVHGRGQPRRRRHWRSAAARPRASTSSGSGTTTSRRPM